MCASRWSSLQDDPLCGVIGVLDTVARSADRERLDVIRNRVGARRLRVLVAGEAKRGKSTLINGLLGRDVLPTGATPVTAVVTSVRSGVDEPEGLTVILDGCDPVRHHLDRLAEFVTESANPQNTRGVREIDVVVRSAMLDRFPLELVDTPGTGSVLEHNTVTAHEAYESLDAAVFVLTASPPISAAEKELLSHITELSVRTFVVLNKADQIEESDLAEVQAFTAEAIRDNSRHDLPLYACVARAGRLDPGFAKFADEFELYLGERADTDTIVALRRHVARLATAMLEATRVTMRTIELAAETSRDYVDQFTRRVVELEARRAGLDERCRAGERTIRHRLDEVAARAVREITNEVRHALSAELAGPLKRASAEELDEQGRDLVIELIRERTDRWRTEQQQAIDADLKALFARTADDVDRLLTDLRSAVHEFLDLDVIIDRPGDWLTDSRRFWYDFSRPVGWELPLADVARRLSPGRARRARARLLAETADLVDRQLGRARADLQDRLHDSVRQLLANLRTVYDDTVGRVRAALDEATVVQSATAVEISEKGGELHDRAATLTSALRRLEAAAPGE